MKSTHRNSWANYAPEVGPNKNCGDIFFRHGQSSAPKASQSLLYQIKNMVQIENFDIFFVSWLPASIEILLIHKHYLIYHLHLSSSLMYQQFYSNLISYVYINKLLMCYICALFNIYSSLIELRMRYIYTYYPIILFNNWSTVY